MMGLLAPLEQTGLLWTRSAMEMLCCRSCDMLLAILAGSCCRQSFSGWYAVVACPTGYDCIPAHGYTAKFQTSVQWTPATFSTVPVMQQCKRGFLFISTSCCCCCCYYCCCGRPALAVAGFTPMTHQQVRGWYLAAHHGVPVWVNIDIAACVCG